MLEDEARPLGELAMDAFEDAREIATERALEVAEHNEHDVGVARAALRVVAVERDAAVLGVEDLALHVCAECARAPRSRTRRHPTTPTTTRRECDGGGQCDETAA